MQPEKSLENILGCGKIIPSFCNMWSFCKNNSCIFFEWEKVTWYIESECKNVKSHFAIGPIGTGISQVFDSSPRDFSQCSTWFAAIQ